MTSWFARVLTDMHGRKISGQTIYRRLAETGPYARRPVVCVPMTASKRKDRLLWSKNIGRRHYKDGNVFISVMSLQTEGCLSSLNLERKWSSLSSLLRNRNRQIGILPKLRRIASDVLVGVNNSLLSDFHEISDFFLHDEAGIVKLGVWKWKIQSKICGGNRPPCNTKIDLVS
ncbi:hypothetical protein TNCV_3684531 [Trichonephila clavipes]|uniref:Transposase n=1 Tax=Trichonephila clavipes TaxID=2585209 RepID=A0A8X6UWG8_TRICX|nr:hypothetical protein TNCV_3684531 [Trichonephila clavipes]